jgi:hypothetical protein
MLTFLSPLLLIGTLAAAIPLIIHLSRSRRTKKMRFSTTRFFTDQFLRSYRMSRLKELLLLACRMALCALLAIAFAQPLFMPKGTSFLSSSSRCVVLVIDNSASMGYTENGRTQLDRARQVARELVNGLGSGDTVSIVLAGRQANGPKVLCEKKPHAELGDVHQDINLLSVSTLSTDLTEAVARAEEIAQSSSAPAKEVYVLSDLQDSGWDVENEKLKSRQDSDVLFFFVRLRPEKVANVAVRAVQYSAPRPMAGVPFAIRPLLSSQGDQARNTLVRLYIYNQKGEPEKVAERPLEKQRNGGWSAPRFYHTFTTGGWHAGYVEVQDENLPQDNRRYFALHVLDAVEVLMVNGAASQVRDVERDPLLFPRAALLAANPEATEGKGKQPITVKVDGTAALNSLPLGKYPLIMLANVARLDARAVDKLEEYVDRGSSLLIFLGDNADPEFYNQTLAATTRPHGGLLPGTLAKEKGTLDQSGKRDDASFAAVSSLAYSHPALAPFEDAKNGNLAGVTFKALWEIHPHLDQARVLMTARELAKTRSAGNQAPAPHMPLLCEKSYGKGRVLLFATTCSRARTNFPMSSSFLPWTHQLVCYLCQKPLKQQGFFATGDAVPLPVSLAEGLPPVTVKKPDGSRGYASMSHDPEYPLEFTDTAQAGIYTLFPDQKDRTQLFAVNLDPYESDLTYLDDVLLRQYDGQGSEDKVEAGLKKLLPNRPLVSFVADPARVQEVSLAARRGVKLWDILLWVVLVLVLFEPWLANRISLRHYARPRELPAGSEPERRRAGQPGGLHPPLAEKQEVSQ